MSNIILKKEDAIARIVFNRPKSLNAFNEPMLEELKAALEDIRTDDNIKVVIVSGEGRAFSAGVDLKATTSSGFQKESSFMQLGEEMGKIIVDFPKVMIAQVHGYCFTGALEFMLFFDMAFCTEDTQFGDTHAKFAILPRWGMTQRLSRWVGLAKAKELTFRAYRVKGIEAERIGLVNRAFKTDDFENEVNKIANEILANNFEAIVKIKELYNKGYSTTLAQGLQLESDTETDLANTDENLATFKGND